MIKRILNTQISLWLIIIILLTAGVGLAVYFLYFQESIYKYNLNLPVFEQRESLELEYGVQPALRNPDFFNKTRQILIDDKVSFIEANLSLMRLTLFDKGEKTQEFPILTKGREGSWWETPAGIYRVENKIKNHFSSFGRVYLPWSLVFQGNFFIHGWPYYEDGTPVHSAYSGGCIRMSSEDAQKIFDFARVGMPVLIFEESFFSDDFVYQTKIPEISGQAFLAADLKNNFVFLERNLNEVLPIASITKLITALVAIEYINMERKVIIDSRMIVETSRPRLKLGQSLRIYDLLYPLLLESSNEAAEAISHHLGQKRFVQLINTKAKAIGMENASFVNASGSLAGNIASAEDLFNLAKHLYFNRSFILRISAGELKETIYGRPIFTNLSNFNFFENYPGFVGGKTGQTKAAGETMLAIFELEREQSVRPIAIIVLNSLDSRKDIEKIWEWIQKNY